MQTEITGECGPTPTSRHKGVGNLHWEMRNAGKCSVPSSHTVFPGHAGNNNDENSIKSKSDHRKHTCQKCIKQNVSWRRCGREERYGMVVCGCMCQVWKQTMSFASCWRLSHTASPVPGLFVPAAMKQVCFHAGYETDREHMVLQHMPFLFGSMGSAQHKACCRKENIT